MIPLPLLGTVAPLATVGEDFDPSRFGWDVAGSLVSFLFVVVIPLLGLALLSLLGKW